MKIGIFTSFGWSIERVFRDIEKHIPEHIFHYLEWSSYNYDQLMDFIQNSDIIITTSYVSVCGFPDFKYFPIQRVLFIAHGAGETDGHTFSNDFIYGLASRHLTPLFPNNVTFLTPNGVDPTLFQYTERNGIINKIGWCGNPQVPLKQIEWGIEIGKQTNTEFNICSKVPCEDDISKWQGILFHEVVNWYQTIDMLLVTSIPKETTETGPLPAFEAIVSGVPVIGTPVGNFSTIPGPKFKTIEEGVEIVNRLKQNPEEVKQLAKEQYEYVMKHYTYESMIHLWKEAVEYVYLNIMKAV